jgi:predicted RNase H-like nuclease (RuvC/YqgF family)
MGNKEFHMPEELKNKILNITAHINSLFEEVVKEYEERIFQLEQKVEELEQENIELKYKLRQLSNDLKNLSEKIASEFLQKVKSELSEVKQSQENQQ